MTNSAAYGKILVKLRHDLALGGARHTEKVRHVLRTHTANHSQLDEIVRSRPPRSFTARAPLISRGEKGQEIRSSSVGWLELATISPCPMETVQDTAYEINAESKVDIAVYICFELFIWPSGGAGGSGVGYRIFTRSVLGCIKADFCNYRLILQYFSRFTRLALFCTAPNATF